MSTCAPRVSLLVGLALAALVATGAELAEDHSSHLEHSSQPGDKCHVQSGQPAATGSAAQPATPLERPKRQSQLVSQLGQPLQSAQASLSSGANAIGTVLTEQMRTAQGAINGFTSLLAPTPEQQIQQALAPHLGQQQRQPALAGLTGPLRLKRHLLQSAGQQGGGSPSLLAELGPQLEKVGSSMRLLSSFSDLFNTNPQQARFQRELQQQVNQQVAPQQQEVLPNFGTSAGALLGPIHELIRSSQQSSGKVAADAQQGASQISQQTANAAQSAQTGIQAALTEIGTGLQKIAANNPSLLPDVKNLYQSVSSKLTSASGSVAQSAQIPQAPPAPQTAQNNLGGFHPSNAFQPNLGFPSLPNPST